MKIVASRASALADPTLTARIHRSPDSESWIETHTTLEADTVCDENHIPRCDVVISLGRELTPEVLSACDLSGVRIFGLVQTPDDTVQLDRLRLQERLTLPLRDGDLDDAIGTNDARPNPLPYRHDPIETVSLEASSSGHVVAVWGAKGSPGVTTTAAGVAAIAAASGLRVALVDADVYGGSIAVMFNLLDEAPGLAAACRLHARGRFTREEMMRLRVPLRHGSDSIDVFTGFTDSTRWPELDPDTVRGVVAGLRREYDMVVLDLGFCLETDEEISSDLYSPRRNGVTLACLRAADVIVAVSGTDPVALTRFMQAHPRLREVAGETTIVHSVNRAAKSGLRSGIPGDVETSLRRFAGIDHALGIPEDVALMRQAGTRGLPAPWLRPKAEISRAYDLIVRSSLSALRSPTVSQQRRVIPSAIAGRRQG